VNIGREVEALKFLERIAIATERMADDPVLEMEVGPPVCPNCGVLNPIVSTESEGGTGHLFEMFVKMHCNGCDTTFYGIPVQWSMHLETSTLRAELQERAKLIDERTARDNATQRIAS